MGLLPGTDAVRSLGRIGPTKPAYIRLQTQYTANVLEIPGYVRQVSLAITPHIVLLRAYRERDDVPVLLKTAAGAHPPPVAVARLLHESAMQKDLRTCASVPRLIDVLQVGKRPVLVTEDPGGHNLQHLLDQAHEDGEGLDLERALTIAIATAEAIAELHRHRILHRDIRPQHLWIRQSPAVTKLLGFASAARLDSRTDEIGDELAYDMDQWAYIAPEQTGRIRGVIDERCDIYALGMVLYRLLSGQSAFCAEDALDWMHCHLAQTPPPMRQHCRHIPEMLDAIVGHMVAKSPDERYQSIAGALHDLRCVADMLKQSDSGTIARSFALGEHDIITRFQVSQRIYGRQSETERLLAIFDEVAGEGGARAVLVGGYSGIGKSTVIQQLHKPVLARQGSFLQGKFEQLRQDVPYAPILSALRGRIRDIRSSPEAVTELWKERLLKAVNGRGSLIGDLLPGLSALLGPQPPLPELGTSESRIRFQTLLRDIIVCLAREDCPCVLFLDDGQWADSASLQFLPTLFGPGGAAHLCGIFAYRDNEVDDGHPFMQMVDEIRRCSVAPVAMTIGPMDDDSLSALIADSLRLDRQDPDVPLLTREIGAKTGGNPFFVRQFLEQLYRDQVLIQDVSEVLGKPGHGHAAGVWRCDLDKLAVQQYTDNVVDLIVQRMQAFDDHTREALWVGAAIGGEFALSHLSGALGRSEAMLSEALWPAVAGNLIVVTGQAGGQAGRRAGLPALAPPTPPALDGGPSPSPIVYRFLHDRIQQAAYALLARQHEDASTDAAYADLHLHIGRGWLAAFSPEEQSEHLFAIVHQLNRAISRIDDAAGQRALLQLNHRAGERAKRSGAFVLAADFYTVGYDLLSDAIWRDEQELAFDTLLSYAECCYLSGKFDRAEELLAEAERRVCDSDIQQRSRVCQTTMNLHMTRGDMAAALATGRTFLADPSFVALGLWDSDSVFPPMTFAQAQASAYEPVERALRSAGIGSLAVLPEPERDDIQAAMTVLSMMWLPAHFLEEPMLYQALQYMVILGLEHGMPSPAVLGLSAYALVLCDRRVGRYREAEEFHQVTQQLIRSRELDQVIPATTVFGHIVGLYNRDLEPWRERLYQSLTVSQQVGDLIFASYSCNHILSNMVATGAHLDDASATAQRLLPVVERLGDSNIHHIVSFQQRFIACLRGETDRFGSFNSAGDGDGDGHRFVEADFEVIIADSQMGLMKYWYYTYQLGVRYHAGDWAGATESLAKADGLQNTDPWNFEQTLHLFYAALLLIQRAMYGEERVAEDGQSAPAGASAGELGDMDMARVDEIIAHYERWADCAPMNFASRLALLKAERARNLRHTDEAQQSYDAAIASARRDGRIHDLALALERSGDFLRAQGVASVADSLLRDAISAYRDWGASGKVQQLVGLYPHIAADAAAATPVLGTGAATYQLAAATGADDVDVLGIIRASQAISSEIRLRDLVGHLLRIACQTSGAEEGVLALVDKDDNTQVYDGERTIPLGQCRTVPVAVIENVRDSGERVILADAGHSAEYGSDVTTKSRGIRSLLCLPLLRRGRVRGVLYLHNSKLAGVFTPKRIVMLEHIAAQAAISIENAEVHDHLEQLVHERTLELEEAQTQMVDLAYQAGMSQIASTVLHNLGNSLNGVKVYAAGLHEHSRRLSLAPLADLAQKIGEKSPEDIDGAFFPKLSRLLTRLHQKLDKHHGRVHEDAKVLSSLVDDTVQLLASQQRHVTIGSQKYEHAPLSEVLDEALRVCGVTESAHQTLAEAAQPGRLQIVRQYQDLRPCRYERHTTLQIFANLITNARDALKRKGHDDPILTLRVTRNRDGVHASVIDNGVGFGENVAKRLFQHGFTTRRQGHGIGLHSAQLQAKAMKGQLRAHSEGPGCGATFTLTLPGSLSDSRDVGKEASKDTAGAEGPVLGADVAGGVDPAAAQTADSPSAHAR